jgi:uncharacterized membrane protein YkvA (DUF1232 family)
MKNRFFNIALAQAARLAGCRGRMLRLVGQLALQLSGHRSGISLESLRDRLYTMGRLVAAFARGHYRDIPLKTFLTILAAVIYFLNPFDFVPDAIVGIGFTDDLAVLAWVYRTTEDELHKFIQWEADSAIPI